MKLGWKDIEPFVKSPHKSARAILVYGPDDGLMRERSAAMGRSVVADLSDPFNVAILSAATLAEDSARLFDEAHAISMMGGARLIRIEDASDKLTTLLKDYLAKPSAENLVILEAGELGPRSSLRLLFEKSDNAAAIPCYVDDARGIAAIFKQSLGEAGYAIQSDALNWRAANIGGDRARLRAEGEKIALYMGAASKTITLEDVRAACGEAADQSLDDLIYAMGSGRAETALKTYAKLIEEGVAAVTILRTLQSHFRRLHYTQSLMKDGAGVDEAMKKLQPAVFFKQVDPFKAQLRKWPEEKLLSILSRLSHVEAQTKQTGAPVETLCAQTVLSLAA